MQNRAATIEDVARAAGVSRAAVSKVIRNAYGVSPTMRERVNAAIEELEYRPRTAARAMRGSSYTLGIEIPQFHNQYFTRILQGATEALAGTRYQLIIAPTHASDSRGYQAVEALVDHQVDGLVTVSPLVDLTWLEAVARRVPVVMLGRHDYSDLYDTIAGDDVMGTGAIMDHLFGLGHDRILHLTLDESITEESNHAPHSVRFKAYNDAMTRSGRGQFIQVARVEDGQDFAYEKTKEVLGAEPRPTAIFAGHDELAIGALKAIAELDANVAVVGYDNVPIAAHPALSLTTVDQDGELMGTRAVSMLLERLQGRTEAIHEVLTPELRIRNSSLPK